MTYSVIHEKRRQQDNLENRLLNVNYTVIDAYEHGVDLQKTVNFIKLFTDQTTLAPLRLTVYDRQGVMLADNPEPTIVLSNDDNSPIKELEELEDSMRYTAVRNMMIGDEMYMVNIMASNDGMVRSFAALPYNGVVLAFLSADPMEWIVVLILGVLSSIIAYIGLKTVCRDVYNLRDFARAISTDNIPEIDSLNFSKDELGEVSQNLLTLYRDKIRAIKEKVRHEHQVSMNVNHELKTPVGIIKGYLDTVLDNESMPEDMKHKFLERARHNADRLVLLINYLTEITQLEDRAMDIERVKLNFNDVIEQLIHDIKVGRVTENMEFSYNVPKDCSVVSNESLIVNALLNLTHNAVRHSCGTKISLNWIEEKDGMQYFSFADNGIGVSKKHLPRLFDLFYRVDKGRSRKNGGNGLGLPIVRKTFTALDGDISVRNVETGGLEFIFSLPAAT